MYGQPASLYPKIGGSSAQSSAGYGGLPSRNPPFQNAPAPPASSGIGIRVAIKPEYKITPPPPLLPQLGDIPRSNFHFDFEFERNVITEAVKDNPNWSKLGLENFMNKPIEAASTQSSHHLLDFMQGLSADPVVSKYMAAGLSREAVPLAVANYGDNPTKVKEFADGFTLLREMGFSSNSVAEALFMYDNDTDKALAHFLNNSS
ncbi:hypothetical protein F511_12976 [Dorcoceras hygrometricum]|uniref:UBA domain-containing protein n=1 Tax=Dorcoceras hygrometricum TaxID=472368 RepID=A0A2Z7BGH1_9LAMI|nr:hypothetical protein F511_12976 [Dorcoceras hygrometricum]